MTTGVRRDRWKTWTGMLLAFLPISCLQNSAPKITSSSKGETHDEPGLIREFAAHQKPIHGMSCHPDRKSIFSVSMDGTIRMWEIATGKLIREFKDEGKWPLDAVLSVACSPHGEAIITGSGDGVVRL